MALTTTQPKAVAPKAFEAELVQMDKGIQANVPAGTSLTINGTAQKQAVIDSTLQGWITIFEAVDTAQAAYKEAVAARLAITVQARTYYKALKSAIKLYFGSQSNLLSSFGITPDKAASTTAQQKLVAAAKRAQTRAVRGTTSKKQKAAITVVGNPPVNVPSTGKLQISPPPVNVAGINTPSTTTPSTASSTAPSTPASTAAPAATTPAPAGSGSGSSTPAAGTTPTGA